MKGFHPLIPMFSALDSCPRLPTENELTISSQTSLLIPFKDICEEDPQEKFKFSKFLQPYFASLLSAEQQDLELDNEEHPTEANISFDPFIQQMSYEDINITALKNRQLKTMFSFNSNSQITNISHNNWKDFISTPMHHIPRNVWYRLLHKKLSTRANLHRIIPAKVDDDYYQLCKLPETEQHTLFTCIQKQDLWNAAFKKYLSNPKDPNLLAFLDIKSANDTVDRNIIWNELSSSIPTPLLALLFNMFEDVLVEVILSNHKSSRFHSKTGVLQGSVLSPYLYSVYINSLPNFLRPAPLVDTDFNDPIIVALKLNCLLYVDDVVLITDAGSMQSLLSKCEEHSLSLGYRWNPKKCVVVDPNSTRQKYYLYNSELPNEDYFPYLGVPIKSGDIVDKSALLQQSINKALGMMRQLITLGVNKNGRDYLLSTRFYAQIVRPQLEYGLAITTFNLREIQSLENCQNQCIRQIFGGRLFTSTKNHNVSRDGPNYPNNLYGHHSAMNISKPCFILQEKHAKLLSHCRNDLIVDPILRIPMTRSERSRCVRWRLGWLPLGKPQSRPFHPNELFSRQHSFSCLDMHNRLQMPKSIDDPLSYLLNLLPSTFFTKKARRSIDAWLIRLPSICAILLEMDYLAHSQFPEASNHLGEPFVKRLHYIQQKFSDGQPPSLIHTTFIFSL
ncbi:hypothetical protein G6F46_010932 [Rhizopus delemar]|uniref:Reverse transcriptase domain-containing protein n=1 Tax=Rhizopus oryzae TaxID=64495 RepID=A0A9P7C4M0_RHIOR|nr:hypothetical protein G6F51_011718 [Rhizopus arrhizus]KAG1595403.1 hypothetical protein G6F47_008504 [Rhizopus delemar]KAG1609245.1 hypothetical protein G6F46_010932 [Rhizopus delemar]KAG1623639.1 hypothetical protein G6F45_010783 [Rhizopus arrhizus]